MTSRLRSRGRYVPTIHVDVAGHRVTLDELASAHGLNPETVRVRYRRERTLDPARLARPADPRFTHRGRWE